MLLRDNLFGTPEEDAVRRDFTVNALSYDIADFSVIDYIGGLEDIEKRIIRTIGDPLVRFTEDPVRMLRAIRLSSQLGFRIENHSWQAIQETLYLLSVPGMRESIKEGMAEEVDSCAEELDW